MRIDNIYLKVKVTAVVGGGSSLLCNTPQCCNSGSVSFTVKQYQRGRKVKYKFNCFIVHSVRKHTVGGRGVGRCMFHEKQPLVYCCIAVAVVKKA